MTIDYSQFGLSRRTPSTSICSSDNKNNLTRHLMKTEFSTIGTAFSTKHIKMKKSWDSSSPYLTPDAGQLFLKTRSKRTRNYSSYPFAVNIYKASSDELRTISRVNNKKVKKSVLTLPNNSVELPQTCTVSDMNDSSYFDREENKVKKNNKKRLPVQKKRKYRNPSKKFEYYDRDAMYCSHMNINIDCSSTHLMNHYNGDGNKIRNADQRNASDVWSVLKNINKCQFRSSPTTSECNFKPKKKRAVKKKLANRRKQTYYESRETEEFAIVCVSQSVSECTSADRVTVVDKVGEQISPHESDIMFGKSVLSSITTVPNMGDKILPKEFLGKIETSIKKTKSRYKQNIGKDTIPDNCLTINNIKIDSNKKPLKLPFAESRQNKRENIKAFSDTKFDNEAAYHNKARVSSAMSKPTLTEIRRRLANLRFPIVILEKDQVTSTAQIVTSNFLQFNGLENQIWPFMLDWTGQNSSKLKQSSFKNPDYVNRLKNKTSNISSLRQNTNLVKKINNDMNTLKMNVPNTWDKKKVHNTFVSSREYKLANESCIKSKECGKADPKGTKKPMPTQEFTDTKLKLLPKKLSQILITANKEIHNDIIDDINERVEAICKTKVARSQYDRQQDLLREDKCARGSSPGIVDVSMPPENKKVSILKYPWAKIRRVNDFIDGVIRKINNGVYYNQEFSSSTSERTKEDSIETSFNFDEDIESSIASLDYKFDDTELSSTHDNSVQVLPLNNNNKVEITTLDTSQITIKHCVTNIIVQFDVTVPHEKDRMFLDENTSFSLISQTSPDTKSKYFKCKSTIINAQLPAEICSILPQMMRKIKSMQAVNLKPLYQYDKKESQLSIIPEMTSVESNIIITPLILQTIFEPSLRGTFSRQVKKSRDVINVLCNYASFNEYSDFISTMLPLKIKEEFTIIVDPNQLIHEKLHQNINQNVCVEPPPKMAIRSSTNNMALQPYYNTRQQMNIFHDYNALDIIKKMFNYHIRNLNFTSPSYYTVNFASEKNVYTITMMLERAKHVKETISVTIDGQKIKSLFLSDCHEENDNKCIKSIDYESQLNITSTRKQSSNNLTIPKTRKRKFVKLYKKCKSTSHISCEKSSTSLCKISNLDDYFQALGSGKTLSSVCDGQIGNRIMSCLNEMKKWITNITPRQALLVLLLNNRNETQNLRCCRPILLQGIAVNRITRAAELDMEIEVIEREKISVLEHEGISYIPSSPENKDSLLEELCWIAKTTASDYQKPFDKSSERLLKSLLEKRKKLNPSYLRVMARYVGLGLLKSQKNN